MNRLELLKNICGTNESGKSKSMFSIFHELWKVGDNDEKDEVANLHIDKPILKAHMHLDYVIIDFEFQSNSDHDLAHMWYFLENFTKIENSIDFSDEELERGIYFADDKECPVKIPVLIFNIVPKKYNGKYSLTAFNPIFHTLQPKYPKDEARVIRTVFNADNVIFNELTNAELKEISTSYHI